MFLARVTGSVVSTHKVQSMVGRKLLTVEPETIREVEQVLAETRPEGGTNHEKAFEVALGLEPEAIFLVTDADDLIMAVTFDVYFFRPRSKVLNPVPPPTATIFGPRARYRKR